MHCAAAGLSPRLSMTGHCLSSGHRYTAPKSRVSSSHHGEEPTSLLFLKTRLIKLRVHSPLSHSSLTKNKTKQNISYIPMMLQWPCSDQQEIPVITYFLNKPSWRYICNFDCAVYLTGLKTNKMAMNLLSASALWRCPFVRVYFLWKSGLYMSINVWTWAGGCWLRRRPRHRLLYCNMFHPFRLPQNLPFLPSRDALHFMEAEVDAQYFKDSWVCWLQRHSCNHVWNMSAKPDLGSVWCNVMPAVLPHHNQPQVPKLHAAHF